MLMKYNTIYAFNCYSYENHQFPLDTRASQ